MAELTRSFMKLLRFQDSELSKKKKRKLTAKEKKLKKELRAKYQYIFINGKQKRVLRPQLIDGMDVDEFIMLNADPIWVLQNEMWDLIPVERPAEHALPQALDLLVDDDVEPETRSPEWDVPF